MVQRSEADDCLPTGPQDPADSREHLRYVEDVLERALRDDDIEVVLFRIVDCRDAIFDGLFVVLKLVEILHRRANARFVRIDSDNSTGAPRGKLQASPARAAADLQDLLAGQVRSSGSQVKPLPESRLK